MIMKNWENNKMEYVGITTYTPDLDLYNWAGFEPLREN